MSRIEIIEKNESITYDQIHEFLYLAHSINRSQGFHVKTAEMDAGEIKCRIGDNGILLLAMDEEKLVGISGVRFVNRNRWYGKQMVADQIFVAVHPDYRGMHISTMLHKRICEYVLQRNIRIIELQTAYNNKNMQNACKKWGFRYTDFSAYNGNDHYTVTLSKWLQGQKPLSVSCALHYIWNKYKTIIKYKPGRINRFFL